MNSVQKVAAAFSTTDPLQRREVMSSYSAHDTISILSPSYLQHYTAGLCPFVLGVENRGYSWFCVMEVT